MEAQENAALLVRFADMEDPRTRRSPHGLVELLLTAIGAVLSGADTWVALDGKIVRRSQAAGQKAIHVVSAFARWTGGELRYT